PVGLGHHAGHIGRQERRGSARIVPTGKIDANRVRLSAGAEGDEGSDCEQHDHLRTKGLLHWSSLREMDGSNENRCQPTEKPFPCKIACASSCCNLATRRNGHFSRQREQLFSSHKKRIPRSDRRRMLNRSPTAGDDEEQTTCASA